MTTTVESIGASGASSSVIAEDVLARAGGVIKRRGPLMLRQHVGNDFDLMRQHVAGTGDFRPAPSIGDYPHGLWLPSIGVEADGYGARDSGTGTYINLGRDREGVWVTQSWWFGVKAQTPADVPQVLTVYLDTEAWGSQRRSYFAARIDMSTGAVTIREHDDVYVAAGSVPVPGWNDNKFDKHYLSLTTYVGPSSAVGTEFGRYGALQLGGKVLPLLGKGGWAEHPPSGVDQPGSSFSGGMNPGIGGSSPPAGKRGGFVIYDFALTIGDTL